jgi:hypothetical protein
MDPFIATGASAISEIQRDSVAALGTTHRKRVSRRDGMRRAV